MTELTAFGSSRAVDLPNPFSELSAGLASLTLAHAISMTALDSSLLFPRS